jgi:hypothetical protein
MKKVLSLVAVAVATSSAFAQFTVFSDIEWGIFVNAFNTSDDSLAFGFEYGTTGINGSFSQASFAGPVLTLGPNTEIYDSNLTSNGGNPDPAWMDVNTLQPNKFIETSTFLQLVPQPVGETFSFSWETLSTGLAGPQGTPTNDSTTTASYDIFGYMIVLDPNDNFATVASDVVPLSVGIQSVSITVPSTTIDGDNIVEFGFRVRGNILSGTDPIGGAFASVTAVPEPSTYALIGGLLALGIVRYRRRR